MIVVGDLNTYTNCSIKYKYHRDINIIALDMLGC